MHPVLHFVAVLVDARIHPNILCKCPTRHMVELLLYLYAVVYEASAVTGGPEMRILFCAGHLDAPYTLPGLIELTVHRVHT